LVYAGRVLILTTFDLDEYVYAALRAGASGFLMKYRQFDEAKLPVELPGSFPAIM
jgi:DNA-binding NarL/FixJ family response regulator